MDAEEQVVAPVRKEESMEAFVEETPAIVDTTKKRKSNASVAVDKFDWDAFESDAEYGVSKEEVEQMYSQILSTVIENEVVEGTVVAVSKREVLVNIGYKSEGIISINEFRYNPELAVGDKVEVYVENAEDKKGQLILSHKKARSFRSWDRVNEAFDKDEIVKGYIKCRTKGGMIVDVFGSRHSCQVHRLMLNLSAITIFSLTRQWS